jgi:hypothetical protein
VWARFGGGHGGGASGVSGYSRGAPNWLAWLGLLILIGVILKAPWHLPHRYQRVTVAERQAITQLFQRYQAGLGQWRYQCVTSGNGGVSVH